VHKLVCCRPSTADTRPTPTSADVITRRTADTRAAAHTASACTIPATRAAIVQPSRRSTTSIPPALRRSSCITYPAFQPATSFTLPTTDLRSAAATGLFHSCPWTDRFFTNAAYFITISSCYFSFLYYHGLTRTCALPVAIDVPVPTFIWQVTLRSFAMGLPRRAIHNLRTINGRI